MTHVLGLPPGACARRPYTAPRLRRRRFFLVALRALAAPFTSWTSSEVATIATVTIPTLLRCVHRPIIGSVSRAGAALVFDAAAVIKCPSPCKHRPMGPCDDGEIREVNHTFWIPWGWEGVAREHWRGLGLRSTLEPFERAKLDAEIAELAADERRCWETLGLSAPRKPLLGDLGHPLDERARPRR